MRKARLVLVQALACLCSIAVLPGQRAPEPVVVRVVDPGGKPVAAAPVEVLFSSSAGHRGLDIEDLWRFERIAAVRTKKNGRALLRLAPGLAVRLRVDVPPHARYVEDHVLAGRTLTVRLQPASTMGGRVVDGRGNGVAASLSVIRAESAGRRQVRALRAPTAPDGSFRFERMMPGAYRVHVVADVGCQAWVDVGVDAGQESCTDIELEPGVVLRGRILDDATGQPLAGAEIGEGWALRKRVRSNVFGRFEMRGYGSPGYHDVHCRAPGFVVQAVVKSQPKRPLTIDFRLRRGQTTSGRVVDPAGAPVAGAYVAAVAVGSPMDWLPGRTDRDGRFRIDGLHSRRSHVLVVRKPGWASVVYNLPGVDSDGVRDAGTIDLQAARVVRGRVVDRRGGPVGGVLVRLYGYNDDYDIIVARPMGRLLQVYVARRECHTETDGRFAFGDVPAGEYRLAVERGSQVLFEQDGLRVSDNADPDPVLAAIDG